jgi:transcriptional regulator with XRE-family HTH domain
MLMETLLEVGQALQTARMEARLSQADAASRSGISRVTLSRMEGAVKGDMSVLALLKVAGTLGLELKLVPRGHRRTLEDVLREQREG